jgi:hypothetical protein
MLWLQPSSDFNQCPEKLSDLKSTQEGCACKYRLLQTRAEFIHCDQHPDLQQCRDSRVTGLTTDPKCNGSIEDAVLVLLVLLIPGVNCPGRVSILRTSGPSSGP